MLVTLTEEQLKLAKEVAGKRNQVHRHVGRADGKVLSNSLEIDFQGALGELSVSLAFQIPWDGQFFSNRDWLLWRQAGHDTGPLEVRSTKHPNGKLILHQKDHDDSPFVLALTWQSPVIKIAGWCWGREGKDLKYWRDVGYGRPCFYVPTAKLHSIDELRSLLKIGAPGES